MSDFNKGEPKPDSEQGSEWGDPQQDPFEDIKQLKKRLEKVAKPFSADAFVSDLIEARDEYIQAKLMGVEPENRQILGNVPIVTPEIWAPAPMDLINPLYELQRVRRMLREALDLHYLAEMELIEFFYARGFGYESTWEVNLGALLFRVIVKGESAELFRKPRLGDHDPDLGKMFPRAVNVAVACETCNGIGKVRVPSDQPRYRKQGWKFAWCESCLGSGLDQTFESFAPFDPTYGEKEG